MYDMWLTIIINDCKELQALYFYLNHIFFCDKKLSIKKEKLN